MNNIVVYQGINLRKHIKKNNETWHKKCTNSHFTITIIIVGFVL